jgi:hypothetical protein
MNTFATGARLLSAPIVALIIFSSCATAPGTPGGTADSGKPEGAADKSPAEKIVSEIDADKHPQKVREAAVISILSDAAVIAETKDGSEIVDIAKNRRVAYETARHIVYILKEKGFDINGSHVSSVGAWMDDDTVYRTKTDKLEASGNRAVIEAVPPLFVNHPFSDDSSQRDILTNLHRNLVRGNQRYFTESAELGIAGDALMVIHLGGRTFYREFLQGQDESLQQGDSVFSLYLVSLKTGEIIWKDILDEKRFPPLKANFFSLSDQALSKFPHRW